MGKREKKVREFGKAKSSRVIWYMWLGCRFLEFEAFGFLSEDGWFKRGNSNYGVSGLGVNYLGYVIEEITKTGDHFWNEDVAGFDTRVTRSDLEDELLVQNFTSNDYHKALMRSVSELAYQNVLALVPRPSDKATGGVVMDLVGRGDSRGSGQTVTYALNTFTNAKTLVGRVLESRGIITEDDIYTTIPSKTLADTVTNYLDEHGEEITKSMAISGDDSVVVTTTSDLGKALHFSNSVGKIRKDIELWEPSPFKTRMEDVEFCSHHYHHLHLHDGRKMVVPCRDQDECIGRGRLQLGGGVSMKEAACQAKAYSQMFLFYFFHRRDLRLGSMIINSGVPINWVPTGRTSWSINQNYEWMTLEDMLSVWNRVWITDNPWMADKTLVDH